MNKIKYIIVILAAAFMSYGDEHKSAGHEHLSCYQCWEVSFGLGKATIEEKQMVMKWTVIFGIYMQLRG